MMQKGTLYWITGLSGAGKTTVGVELFYRLKARGIDNLLILDGDILKNVVGGGYSPEDRMARAKKYSILCKTITDQGISVICCTVAMFEEIRKWNRDNIENYIEVYLYVPMEELKKRNKKNLYSGSDQGEEKRVVGVDLYAEFPQNPDIKVNNYAGGDKLSDTIEKIISFRPRTKDSYNRDVNYWNAYYQKNPAMENNLESPFARAMLAKMERGKSLIEFGCGNGRDSIFFANNGIEVLGIDIADGAIDMLKAFETEGLRFLCEDFAGENAIFQKQHDYCYSRFTLHAISDRQEKYMLNNAYDTLKNGGLLFIEARSINDDLCGLGKCVGNHEYIYNGHYRRFISAEALEKSLKDGGFRIQQMEEKRGFAPFKGEDPVLIRVIAEKAAGIRI